MDVSSQHLKSKLRLRYQLLLGLAIAMAIPFFVRYGLLLVSDSWSDLPTINKFFWQETNFNSLIGILFAVIGGFFLALQFSKYPGVTIGPNVWLSYVVTFATLFTVLVIFRFEYSRFLLLAGFILAVLWFVFTSIFVRRDTYKVAFIPGGAVSKLTVLADPTNRLLSTPGDLEKSDTMIVADLRHNFSEEWQKLIANTVLLGTPLYHVKQFEELTTGRVSIEHLSENSLGSVIPSLLYLRVKALLDVIFAVLISPLILLIGLFVSLAILIVMGRPIFFTQDRMGYRGNIFTIYKFRSMFAEDQIAGGAFALRETEVEPGDQDHAFEASKTKIDDPRIGRLGKFLRKYRLDELPQVLNICQGQMSWIGPRPEAVPLATHYEKNLPFYSYRHIVRPGISGWAQVNQGHVYEDDKVLDKLHYDFFYIKNISLWLDTIIGVRTVLVLLKGIGAK